MIEVKNLSLKKNIQDLTSLNFHVPSGESLVLLSVGEKTFNHLTNIFCGLEKNFKGTVKVEDIVIKPGIGIPVKNRPWMCLSPYKQWPADMKVGSLLRFFMNGMNISEDEYEELYITMNLNSIARKKIGEIKESQWRQILINLMRIKQYRNVIIRDMAVGMSLDFKLELIRRIQEMKKSGCSVLYLSNDVFFAPEIGDRICFLKKGRQLLELKANRMNNMNLQELYFKFLAER